MRSFCKCLASNTARDYPWQGESACLQFASEGYDVFQHSNSAKFTTYACVIREQNVITRAISMVLLYRVKKKFFVVI